jgi:hypothetical protein
LAQFALSIGGLLGRGAGPLALVKGRRIGSFDEVRKLPSEAIGKAITPLRGQGIFEPKPVLTVA